MGITVPFSVKFPIVNKFFTNKSFALINNLIFQQDLFYHLLCHMFYLELASLCVNVHFLFSKQIILKDSSNQWFESSAVTCCCGQT